jgi:probable addiction module antidote protein
MTTVRPVKVDEYRDDPSAVAEYLNAALSTADPTLILRAVRAMVHAQGKTRFSRRAGIARNSLVKFFDVEESPAFDTVMTLLFALDIQLVAKPAERSVEKPAGEQAALKGG